jgi:hypothetical protein
MPTSTGGKAAHLQAPLLSNRQRGALLLAAARHAIVANSNHTFIVPRLAQSQPEPGRCPPPQLGFFFA